MEQKAKWVYVGETHDLFIKGKIYAEDNTYTQAQMTIKHAVEQGKCKIFLGEGGQPVLFEPKVWTKEFYKL